MSNPWSGKLAKSIMGKKRPRVFWNTFFGAMILITLIVSSIFLYQAISVCFKYDSEQIFIDYKDGYFITDITEYKLPKSSKAKNIMLIDRLDSGDQIFLSVSSLSGELLEVRHLNDVVYQKAVTPIVSTILVFLFIICPMLGSMIFMIVVVNIKNPSKRIYKIQKELLLQMHQ